MLNCEQAAPQAGTSDPPARLHRGQAQCLRADSSCVEASALKEGTVKVSFSWQELSLLQRNGQTAPPSVIIIIIRRLHISDAKSCPPLRSHQTIVQVQFKKPDGVGCQQHANVAAAIPHTSAWHGEQLNLQGACGLRVVGLLGGRQQAPQLPFISQEALHGKKSFKKTETCRQFFLSACILLFCMFVIVVWIF